MRGTVGCMVMSIELLLLQKVERATECSSTLRFSVPESCDGFNQMFGFIAQYHLVTWMVIAFFFIMLISAMMMFKK